MILLKNSTSVVKMLTSTINKACSESAKATEEASC